MAEDANARIRVDIDTAAALANIKNLQRQISTFHTSLAKSGAAATASSLQLQQSLLNGINRTGQFSASIKNVRTTTESFTNALEKNKLSMREYFRYAGASTKTFGSLFRSEFDTINKVARERVKDLQTQYIKMGRDANGAMRAIAVRPLALDMENLATKTQIAAQRQALLNQLLKQGSTNLLNFGKNTQWAGRQLMVGFTVPLVMFGAVASKTFMDMEKQAIRFKRVYGEMFTTTAETTKALEEVKQLANEFTKYGIAVSKTMELAADIAATGKMGAELTAQVAESTRLAVLGGVEQAEALKATISLTDAFGVSAEQLAGKIDFLNAVENQTITSIEDLTIAIPKAGPVVQQLGGDVQDLTFFLTAMREGGINASEGANALKSGLASMINPTGKAAEMLQGFGINLQGIVEANKGNVKGIVIDFAKALDTLDPLNRAQAIEQLFGKFQFARLSTLFQNVIKEGNQASRVLKLANATTAELAILSERELKKVEESPMFKFQKALEDIKVTLVPLGEAFLKAVTPLLEFGTKVLEKFNELDEGAKGFVVGLTAIAGVIGPVFLMGFGLIANGVANIIKMFTFFKATMNKTGTASQTLGMQTDYMTQQQLEASAVAASLNQVHQTLRQTFTSETTAVNALTAAYERGIVKQQAFMGTAAGRGRAAKGNTKVPGYSEGVSIVPGPKGAGDVVPAMLSPGEAVIPAKKADKYRGLIQGIIAGNIPGFEEGIDEVPGSRKKTADGINPLWTKLSNPNAPAPGTGLFGDDRPGNWNFLSARPGGFKRGTPESDRWIAQNLGLTPDGKPLPQKPEKMAAPKPPQPSRSSQYIPSPFDEYDKQLAKGKSAPPTPKVTAPGTFGDGVPPKYTFQSARPGGFKRGTPESDRWIAQNLGLTPTGEPLPQKPAKPAPPTPTAKAPAPKPVSVAATAPKPRVIPPKPATVMTYTNATQFLPSATNVALDTPEGAKIKDIKNFMGKSGPGAAGPMAVEIADRIAGQAKGTNKSVSAPEIEKVLKDAKMDKKFKTFGNEYSRVMNEQLAQAQAKGITNIKQDDFAKMAKTASLEAAKKAGISQKIVKAILTEKTTVKETDGGRRKSMFARGQGRTFYENRAELARQQAARMSPSGKFNAAGLHMAHISPNERMTPEALRQDAKQRGFTLGTTAQREIQKAEGKAGPIAKTTKETVKQEKVQRKATKTTNEATKAVEKKTKADTKSTKTTKEKTATETKAAKVQTDSDRATKRREAALKGVETRRANAAAKTATAGTAAPGAKPARPGMGVGAAGMIASGAVMAGSMMPGEVGKVSQELMMPVMLLSMIAPMLKSPVSIAIAAVAALAAGIYFLNQALSEATKKGAAAAKAMTMTGDKLQGMSEMAGTVSASEIADKTRTDLMSGGSEGQRKFGQSYLDSESGKALLADVSSMTASGMDSQQVGKNLSNQLGYAIMQGVITQDQAMSIASALGEKLGDYSIPAKISGELVGLFGRNGENLLNEPLTIALEIQKDSMANIEESFATRESGNLKNVKTDFFGNEVNPLVRLASNANPIFAVLNAIDTFNDMSQNREMTGASLTVAAEQLAQNKGLVDSLKAQYDQQIAIKEKELESAKTATDRKRIEQEINDLLSKRDTDIQKLRDANEKALNTVMQQSLSMDKTSFDDGFKTAAANVYTEGTDKIFGDQAIKAIDSLDNKREFQVMLSLGYMSKELHPNVITALIAADEESGGKISTTFTTLLKTKGSAEANDLMLLLTQSNIDKANYDVFLNMFSQKDRDFDKSFDAMSRIVNFAGKYGYTLDLNVNGEEQIDKIQGYMDATKDFPEEVTLDYITSFADKTKDPVLAEQLRSMIDNWDVISGGDNKAKYAVTVDFLAGRSDPGVRAAYLAEKGISPMAYDRMGADQKANIDAQASASTVGERGGDAGTDGKIDTNKNTKDGGSGRASNPLDGILKALQNVRKASINAQGGVKELFKLFEKGKNISVFKGIENQLLNVTSNVDFSSFIAGLDKQEQKLFITIKKGNVELTKRGRLLEKAYRAKSIGEFVLSQQKAVISSKNELTARRLLIKAGYSHAEAVELSRDAIISEAYASAATIKNKKDRLKAIRDITKALKQGLLAQDATLTAEEKFNNLYEKVQAKLDADRSAIELKFALDSAADDKIIRDAENKIAEIQYKLDDQEAGLTLISDKEDVINEKYDKRLEALNKIKSINDNIAQQQRNQLSLANALSSGDIGAAASAMQQIQEDFVSNASAKQEDLIEKARQQELLKVTTLINGELKTRKQIEDEIKKLQKEIFDQEEKNLEPAQERNRKLIAARDEALLKLDQEANKWEGVKNKIDLAKTAVIDYAKELANANALAVQAIKDAGETPAEDGEPKGSDPEEKKTFKGTRPGPDQDGKKKGEILVGKNATWKWDGKKWNKISDVGTNDKTPKGDTPDSKQDTPVKPDEAGKQSKKEKKAETLKTERSANIKKITNLNSSVATMEASLPKLQKTFDDANMALKSAKQGNVDERRKQFNTAKARLESTIGSIENLKTSRTTLGTRNTVIDAELKALGFNKGGVVPAYMFRGGAPTMPTINFKPIRSDKIPAMLTPGEFIMSRDAVSRIGLDTLNAMNRGEQAAGSVYNYSVSVNVATNANSNEIARTVITQIKQIDSQRIRGVGLKR
jgi:hypothetical protein